MCVSMIVDIVTIITFVSGVGLATKTSVSRRVEDRALYLALKKKFVSLKFYCVKYPLNRISFFFQGKMEYVYILFLSDTQ